MKVTIFNTGSTSLRFDVIELKSNDLDDFSQYRTLASGIVRGIGSQEATLKEQKDKQTIEQTSITASDYAEAAKRIWEWLKEHYPDSIKNIDAVGHRVVHGGHLFDRHVSIDKDVISKIESLADIAPLHNPPAVKVIKAARTILHQTPIVAVFDTVFHRTIPERAWRYGLPLELADKHHIRRYGFHGISHEYLTLRYAQITNRPLSEVNIITLHLESGCSATAVKNGRSIDTSMGFTPLEGLVMGKRCGDIDPAIVSYLVAKGKSLKEIEQILNKESGLLGLSGLSHDTRELRQNLDSHKPDGQGVSPDRRFATTSDAEASRASLRVKLAFEVFSYRISKYIGAYLTALNGAEAVIFSGGIGENTILVRELVCKHLSWCGLTLDAERNQKTVDREGCISTDNSTLKAYVIPTKEAIAIARSTINCLN